MAAGHESQSPGTAVEIADGIHVIDTGFQGTPGSVAAYLVAGPDGLALVETGPSTVKDNLLAGIASAGFAIDDVTDVVVTHIHLDHAGGLGELMRDHDHLQGWVHPVGLPHMLAPDKLLSSATRIYGDRMDELWGAIVPAPEDRLHATGDRETIRPGGRSLTVYDTPGHASHHIALLDEQTGSLFTGDVAGVRIQGTSLPIPPLPPPDIDIAAWKHSIELMFGISPERLLLTHFGVYTDAAEHLRLLRDGIDEALAVAREVLIPGGSDDELTRQLELWARAGLEDDAERVWPALDAANPMFMSSLGLHRVLRKTGELEG